MLAVLWRKPFPIQSRILSIAILWISVISCEHDDRNPTHLFSDLENDPEKGINAIVNYLRGDDFRIVPIVVSSLSKRRQHSIESLENSPEKILKLLSPDQTTNLKTKAAEALHLLVNENYGMAQRIGLQSWLPGSYGIGDLVRLIKEGSAKSANADVVLMGEEAAQAIWALTRLSIDNLEMAIEKGIISAFVDVIMADVSPRFTMLACASLKRLLADQYSTPSGEYSSKARVVLKNSKARAEIVSTAGFLQRLIDLLNTGRVSQSTPRAEWPRYADMTQRLKPTIQAWAAAAMVGTIALNEEARPSLMAGGVLDLLCAMKESPDALEQVEAAYALQGLDEDCSGDTEL